MRSFAHWNIRYIICRINEIIYHKIYPDHPWLTKTANIILESMLKITDVGLEFGSGRSTLWIARRIAFLTSVEHNINWYQKINDKIIQNKITNVKLIYSPEEDYLFDATLSNYVKNVDFFENNSLDFVLIDGIYRDACANEVLKKVRPGGFIVIDNINWFIPSESFSPNSRKREEGAASKKWEEFLKATNQWRSIWTTSGVSDTAFFIKSGY